MINLIDIYDFKKENFNFCDIIQLQIIVSKLGEVMDYFRIMIIGAIAGTLSMILVYIYLYF
ncbi:MAG: hypothetical protein K0R55_3376, partial [Sporomusa sp.]|nr:hypothetical protein [Sporomusa sp.]